VPSFGEKDAICEPAELALLQQAYDRACRILGIRAVPAVVDDNKGLRGELEYALLYAVRLGERDPVALTATAIFAGKRYRHAPKR
jgi:hypothetical protein